MATWHDLVRYVRSYYRVVREEPDEIRVEFQFGDADDGEGRTQIVVLSADTEGWVQIASPFARVDQVDLRGTLEVLGRTTVVGSLLIMGDYVVLRHTLPLPNMDLNEFDQPLEFVASTADLLEEQYVGGDGY